MQYKTYFVGVRWDPWTPRVQAVERVLDPLGDWVRFNDQTWLLSTTHPSRKLYEALQEVLSAHDLLLVIALNPKDRFGLAPRWVWDWIDSQRGPTPRTVAEIVGGGLGLAKDTEHAGH